MRTFIALVLLAAVATQGFTQKYGALKGAFYSGFSVAGSSKDTDAPMVTNIEIEGSDGNYMLNITAGMMAFDVTFSVDDEDDMVMCDTSFWMGVDNTDFYAMWNGATTVGSGAKTVSFVVDAASYEGEFMGMVDCYDMTGNKAWWTTEEGFPSVIVENNAVDMTPYDLSAYTFTGGNIELNADDSDDPYVDVIDTLTLVITYDNSVGAPQAAVGKAVAWVHFTPDNTILDESDMPYEITCAGGANGGSCTWTWNVYSTWDFGNYEITDIGVSDAAGNWAWYDGAMDDIDFTIGSAPDEVISCQSLDLDDEYYPDQDATVDADGQDAMLYLVAGCNSQSALESDYNMVSVTYGVDVNGEVYGDDEVLLAGESYSPFTYLDYDTAEVLLEVTFTNGVPSGNYRLDSLTTVTQWGGTQVYSFSEGAASSISCAFGAVVAVVVALLL